MDEFNALIGSLQLALAALQFKINNFSGRRSSEEDRADELHAFGEAVRAVEYALAETVAHIGRIETAEPDARLAELWRNASMSLREIGGSSELADIAFEKQLFWTNPEFFDDRSETQLYRISLENVLDQVRGLRGKHDNIQRKRNSP